MNVKSILELCTCHVTQSDIEKLDVEENFSAGNFEYGTFFYLPWKKCDLSGYSSSFRKVCALAKNKGCSFVLLDRDVSCSDSEELDINEW